MKCKNKIIFIINNLINVTFMWNKNLHNLHLTDAKYNRHIWDVLNHLYTWNCQKIFFTLIVSNDIIYFWFW